jgi:hypothetical protein
VLDRAVQNLLYLHDRMAPEVRARAKLWYDGANKMVHNFSGEYGSTPEQNAGVLAVLSPQKDWFQNVDLGRRILDTWKNRDTVGWDPRMDDMWENKVGKAIDDDGVREKVRSGIVGKPLREITDPFDRAVWLRLHDEATRTRNYPTVTPEGEVADLVRTKAGDPGNVAWGDFNSIGKALSILDNGSRENIHTNLGNEHKIRNFYNNIINPNSRAGHVTIDTHAVAAALLRALSGSSKEVSHNFGGTGSSSSNVTGESGMYGLWAEAYRRAAAERGLLPREMQSITWEGLRSLFSPAFKRSPKSVEVDMLHRQVSQGKMSREQALRRIEEITDTTDGIKPPSWFRPDPGVPEETGR